MPKFQRKPLVIEAVQNLGPQNWKEVFDFIKSNMEAYAATPEGGVEIRTPDGTMVAEIGDWIVRSPKGWVHPCKQDEFESEYQPWEPPMSESEPVQCPIRWNPGNKVVQDHRDGTIDIPETNRQRFLRGLPVPWTPAMAESETQMPDIF